MKKIKRKAIIINLDIMKRIFLLLFFLGSVQAFSQIVQDSIKKDTIPVLKTMLASSTIPDKYKNDVNPGGSIIFPSPTASSLINLQNNDVNLYLGRITQSIPLFNFSSNDISVPIVLNYSSSGVKVNEIAGWVGTGWNLQSGGQIVRVMKGLPDEYDSDLKKMDENGTYIWGYGYTRLVDKLKNVLGKDPYTYMSPDNVALLSATEQDNLFKRATFYDKDNAEAWDTQPDEFYFNFGGYSGKFAFNADGQIITIPSYNFVINYTLEQKHFVDRDYHLITSFEVTTDDGYKYVFGTDAKNAVEYTAHNSYSRQFIFDCSKQERCYVPYAFKNNENSLKYNVFDALDQYVNIFNQQFTFRHFSSTWYLIQIVSPRKNTVNFNYSKSVNDLVYLLNKDENHIFRESYKDRSSGLPPGGTLSWQQLASTPLPYYSEMLSINKTRVIHSNIVLMSIVGSDGSNAVFDATPDRLDLINGQRLNQIKIYNPKSEVIKIFDLKYADIKSVEPRLNRYYIKGDNSSYVDEHIYNDWFPGYVEQYKQSEETRMYLTELSESGLNNLKANPYKFSYYDSEILPPRFSPKQDKYGYYNNGGIKPMAPMPIINDYLDQHLIPHCKWAKEYTINGVLQLFHATDDFRSAGSLLDRTQIGVLKSIQFPTGGSKIFEYELNTNSSGGLRVKSISRNYGNKTELTQYLYEQNNYYDYFYSLHISPYFTCYPETDNFDEDKLLVYNLFSTPKIELPNNLGYSKVTLINGPGKTEFYFTDFKTNCDIDLRLKDKYNGNWDYTFLGNESAYYFSSDNFWSRGLLTDIKTYSDNAIYPLSVTHHDYVYTTRNPKYSYSLIQSNYQIADVVKVNYTFTVKDDNCNSISFNADTYFEDIVFKDIYRARFKYHFSDNFKLTKTTDTLFDLNYLNNYDKAITTVKEYTHDSQTFYVTSEKSYNAKSPNETIVANYKYPKNVLAEPYISNLIAANRLNEVVQKSITNNGKPIGVSKTIYSLESNYTVLPHDFQISNTDEDSLKNEYKISKYDDRGNVLETHKNNGTPYAFEYTSYLWAYNKSYPVAKIENSNYQNVDYALINIGSSISDIETKSIENNDEADLIQIFNSLRVNALMKDALITSYTYDPLIGIRSETDPSGKTTYYEYDGLGRLIFARDQDNNIVKSYDYHYKAN